MKLIIITALVFFALTDAQKDQCRKGPRFNAAYWESQYNFEPLPIGGQIVTTVESPLPATTLPSGYPNGTLSRPMALQAFCLLQEDEVNVLHKLPSDSTWYYIAGNPLRVYVIDQDTDELKTIDVRIGQYAFVRAGDWKGARILGKRKGRYSLVMAINVPGVQPSDVAMPGREELTKMYPQHAEAIKSLTFDP